MFLLHTKRHHFFLCRTSLCLGRPYHFKFFKGCLPQILLGPFLNTLTHLSSTFVFLSPYTYFKKLQANALLSLMKVIHPIFCALKIINSISQWSAEHNKPQNKQVDTKYTEQKTNKTVKMSSCCTNIQSLSYSPSVSPC